MFYFPIPEKNKKSKTEYNCERCKLIDKKQMMQDAYIGKNYNGLVIVAQSPSKEDFNKNMPLSNEKAIPIRSILFKNKINIAKDVAITYAIKCVKSKPKDMQYKCCIPFLHNTLKNLKPKLIICLGDMTFKSIINSKSKGGITQLRNRIIPNHEFNCLIFPVYNPNDIGWPYQKYALQQDLVRISKKWHQEFYKRTVVNKILEERKILKDITINEIKTTNEIKRAFNLIHQLKIVSLDYEATNTKPYDHWFEMTHIGISTASTAWVFHESLWLNNPENDQLIKNSMIRLLTNPNVLKIIQNAKFEDLVSRYIYGIKQIENTFCTMLATHVIDERRGCTGLDFQNLVRFGIPPYSDTVKSFLKKKDKNDKINTIRKAPHDDMILYSGLDVITAYHNYLVLSNVLLPVSYEQAQSNYEFLAKGHWLFANMSQRGIPINRNILNQFTTIIDSNIETITKKIIDDPKVSEYNNYLFEKSYETKKSDKVLKQLIKQTKKSKKSKRIKLIGRKITI